MKRAVTDPNQIQNITLNDYEDRAESFWHGTKSHDVSQNYRAFLSPFINDKKKNKKLDILDLGCGPGRDVFYFKSLGHRPVGLDGCENFCTMAREYTGCKVLHQRFLELSLDNQSFDGIFANASLFHVPSQELPRVLDELYAALRPEGILFMSNPRGNEEGWSGVRYGHYMEIDTCSTYLKQAGFKVLDHYYRPEGKPKEQQPWLAVVSQRC